MRSYRYEVEVDYCTYTYECLYEYVNTKDFSKIILDEANIWDYMRDNKLTKGDVGVRILRFFGELNFVYMPEAIDELDVVELGKYCFAPNSREIDGDYESDLSLLAGEVITKVYLSKNVVKLASYTFYNCKNLETLSIEKNLKIVDGDAFMNASKLNNIEINATPQEKTALRKILSQLKLGLLVSFKDEKGILARFYYPEYSESYEEIGPAHIFALNMEGEGYRARQQFSEELINIAGYDETFHKAIPLESVDTLALMAVYRLMYPIGLIKDKEDMYNTFVEENCLEITKEIIRKKDMQGLEFMLKKDILSATVKMEVVSFATSCKWLVGVAKILGA
jgi:hypothetical protein